MSVEIPPFPRMTFPIERGPERYAQMMALYGIAKRMSDFGVRVDARRCMWHIAEAKKRAERFRDMFLSETKLPAEALGKAGAGQTHAVRDFFWEEHKAPKLSFHKRTKKPQFNSPTLLAYATDFKDTPYARAAAALLGLRSAITAGRFARAYLEVSRHYGGRIHFGFNPSGTKGERWSSSASFRWLDDSGETVEYSLNAQNVPSKEPTFEFEPGIHSRLALSLRDCFIPDSGCLIGKADYDQQELRLIAYNAGAKRLIDWINSGADPHIENAKGIMLEFKLPANAKKSKGVKPEPGSLQDTIDRCRDCCKTAQYNISYQDATDSSPGKPAKYPDLLKAMRKHFPNMQEELLYKVIVPRFFKLHPEIRAWQWNTRRSLEELGKITLKSTGAFLYLPPTMRGRNQALNYQMQSGGGAIINRAIIEIDKGMSWRARESAILFDVHDELDVQAPLWDINRVKDLVEEHMGCPIQIGETYTGIPAAWDPGYNWGACESIKDFFKPDGQFEQRCGSAED